MRNETAADSALQAQQSELIARAQEEPNIASVMAALEHLYSAFPSAITYPTFTTTFGTGTNADS